MSSRPTSGEFKIAALQATSYPDEMSKGTRKIQEYDQLAAELQQLLPGSVAMVNFGLGLQVGREAERASSLRCHNSIGGKPQLAFGGRSVFWSGLIPQAQDWELDFFPDNVRSDLASNYFDLAADRMNESFSLGDKAKELVEHFRSSPLNSDFDIHETPRALHQPYLNQDGTPRDRLPTIAA